ncbi:MAG TPA: SDR family oxidoreductase [Stellaceae bacterium]|jgi:nucleoside-diphosphate-sugar epimerase|nr:SDR family oxidoreductase [Stellaceae bacterium]
MRDDVNGAGSRSRKKVLVTGAGGYIGSVLCKDLIDHGYSVVAFDRFFFGVETLRDVNGSLNLTLVKKDIRDIEECDLEGVHAVCDLAALSNDPSGELNPDITEGINHAGRVRVAETAKRAGVERYVLSSSCSVYGHGNGAALDEASETRPLTTYARANLRAEAETLALAGDGFCATALRNATVFGLSPRMRFDLVVNLMTLHAVEKGRITIMGGGKQWRPLVHIRDVARAFRTVLEAPKQSVRGAIFNIGRQNAQVLSIAYIIRETLPFPLQIEVAPDDPDRRDYNVSFDRAKQVLGFEAQGTIADGTSEIYEALKMGLVENGPKTSTVRWYRNVIEAQKLVESVALNGRLL